MKKTFIITLLLALVTLSAFSQNNFAPLGAEWYYDYAYTPGLYDDPVSFIHWEVTGDTVIQGHTCSVLTPPASDYNGDQYVYEVNNKVYWLDKSSGEFTTLYDFSANANETWHIIFQNIDIAVNVNRLSTYEYGGRIYRVQHVTCTPPYGGSWPEAVFEGIGFQHQLFPFYYAASQDNVRCYLEEGELLFHIGDLDCAYTRYCWEGGIADAYDGGDGTRTNPYQIRTSEQLALLAQQTNTGSGGDAYYKVTDIINLGSAIGVDVSWVSIGTPEHPFTGHFDGGNFLVHHMTQNIDESENSVGGLFGFTNGADIKNIDMFFCHLSGKARYLGTVVGYAGWTNIENCTVDECNTTTTNVDGVTGGIVGFAGSPYGVEEISTEVYTISDCILKNENECKVNGTINVGGIVGQVNTLNPYQTKHTRYVISNCTTELSYHYDINAVLNAGGIVGKMYYGTIDGCLNQTYVASASDQGCCGGIVGAAFSSTITDCTNIAKVAGSGYVGGIAGSGHAKIKLCVNKGEVICNGVNDAWVGGICAAGAESITNSYNRGTLTATIEQPEHSTRCFIGGISGYMGTEIRNVYNYCTYNLPDLSQAPDAETGYGKIVGYEEDETLDYNCYWLYHWYYYNDTLPACGNPDLTLQNSCYFQWDSDIRKWLLEEPQYETYDFIEALNAGSMDECLWVSDDDITNAGYPLIKPFKNKLYHLLGNEWYYEITNHMGDTTYQHLEYAADTTLSHKKVKVIVKTNTLYDKNLLHDITSQEYIYEMDENVYWWDKIRKEFTVLYDFDANEGDEWTITYGTDSIVMHVDEVGELEYNGRTFKTMTVSDENNIFSGTIVCGIGHLTSFFPEKLLNDKAGFDVDGIRCYWKGEDLLFKIGTVDCDYVYNKYHYDVDENEIPAFTVYPNPATNVVTLVGTHRVRPDDNEIIELLDIHGQLMKINVQNNQIDVSNLPNGIYFIKIGEHTMKLIVNR